MTVPIGDVFVRHLGDGDVPVLALHCGLAHSGAWKPLSLALGPEFAFTAPDMPSHGRCAKWDGVTDIHDATYAGAMAAMDGPAHVIGHSFGATVALRIALEHPERVLSLTLIEPVLFAACKSTDPMAYAAYLQIAEPFSAAWDNNDWVTAARGFISAWGNDDSWDDIDAKAQQLIIAQMPTIKASQGPLFGDTAGLTKPGGLEALDMPVLLLRGARSQPVIEAIHNALLARMPGAREQVIDGAGHMLPITHARECAVFIRPHIRRAQSSSPCNALAAAPSTL